MLLAERSYGQTFGSHWADHQRNEGLLAESHGLISTAVNMVLIVIL